MASNFKRLLILAIALFWLLPAQSVFAAKDCDEVEESVSGLSEKKALNKIKTQLRLHFKSFKKRRAGLRRAIRYCLFDWNVYVY